MDTPLHDFASAHDGVVTVAVARTLGHSWEDLRALVRHEGWRRLVHGAYLAPGAEPSVRAWVRAHQMRQPALVASHRAAVVLHGGAVLTPGIDFTVDGDGRHDVSGGRLYQWALRRGDVGDVGGLLVTSSARTAADVLRACARDEAVIAVNSLLRTGVVTLREIAAALDGVRGRRHTRRAWRAFARLDPASGSVAESRARLVLHDAGLFPRTQVVLVDVTGRRVRVDFWFAEGVVVEVEGFAFHATRDQHQADVARFNELASLRDVTVLRFSWADVLHRPVAMVSTVRAALRRARPGAAAARYS